MPAPGPGPAAGISQEGEVELLSDQVRVRLANLSLLNGVDRHFHQDVLVITQNAANTGWCSLTRLSS